MITQQSVREALSKVEDPGLKRNIIDLQMVKEVLIEQGRVRIVLAFTTLGCPMKEKIVEAVEKAVKGVAGVSSVDVDLTAMKKEELDQLFEKHPLKGITGKIFASMARGLTKTVNATHTVAELV